jgi:hypothetical protein
MIIKTLNSLDDEEKFMIGIRKEIWWKRTLILHGFLFYCFQTFPYNLNLFSDYYKYCIVANMDFGRNFVLKFTLWFL